MSKTIYCNGRYFVSKEDGDRGILYHVWLPGVTHATADSAYKRKDYAICRCDYLSRNNIEANYWHDMPRLPNEA